MNGNAATEFNLSQLTPKPVTTVAILGAESTGKTTLCRDLAAHFDSPWVPEYMRIYLQKKWDSEQATCTWEDLLPIAQGQINLENKQSLQSAQQAKKTQTNGYLFCDTSLFELMVYANWYYGDCPTQLTTAALNHHYDLILLTDVDIAWVADDLRDSPHDREAIRARFADELKRYGKDFRCVGGDRQQRVETVSDWLRVLD